MLNDDVSRSTGSSAQGEMSSDLVNEYKFLKLFIALTVEDRKKIGVQFNDSVVSCVFKEKNCLTEE